VPEGAGDGKKGTGGAALGSSSESSSAELAQASNAAGMQQKGSVGGSATGLRGQEERQQQPVKASPREQEKRGRGEGMRWWRVEGGRERHKKDKEEEERQHLQQLRQKLQEHQQKQQQQQQQALKEPQIAQSPRWPT